MSNISKKSIAVISDRDDAHIPFVSRHLDRPLVILDPAGGALSGRNITYKLKRQGTFELAENGKPIKDIYSIWYRRPSVREPIELPVPGNLRHYSLTALENFERFLWTRYPKALWVSNPFAMAKANDKLWQLEIAASLGMNVPKTLVTSSSQAAKDFVKHNQQVITKSVGVRYFKDAAGQQRVFFTRKVDAGSDFSGLNLAPAFFQQAIDADVDIRVTVVGSKVFAAAIRGTKVDDPSSSVRDWRVANFDEKMDIEIFDLPPKLEKSCVELVLKQDLKFGAIDLILDKKGKFWFLENNPDGQWAFVEDVTGQPIGKAIAQLLTGE